MLLCSSAAGNLHDAAQNFFHKKRNNVSDQLTESSNLVESISGDRGSIFKSVFPRTVVQTLPSPAHRSLHTPADVPLVFSFPSLHRQIGFKFLSPSSFHPLNPPPPLLSSEDVRNPAEC